MNPVALIIDDEVQIRRLLRLVLEGENYKVHEAETGQLGLMEIATRKPDVVLLDLGLPDLDGLQVLKRLREWSEVPVIVLTVRDDVQEKVAALDAGADDYITKPFSTPELLARLRAAQRKTRPSEEVSYLKMAIWSSILRRMWLRAQAVKSNCPPPSTLCSVYS
jgi:Response regulators consisting of a CheY-like receiver domain and a winged-helix DNA-binding domain